MPFEEGLEVILADRYGVQIFGHLGVSLADLLGPCFKMLCVQSSLWTARSIST
jgi:hypothetical protein